MHNKKSASNLVWLDLEMTGLDHNTNVIIEIATIVTNKNLEIIARGPVIAIHQSESKLEEMDDWCIKTHTNSGLVNRVRESKVSTEEAELLTLEFIKQWIPERQSPLCGNSIGTDRRFMFKYMPKLENYFHYRVIDISTIKELALRWRTDIKPYSKRNCHLALEDIEDSIEELKYYVGSFINKNKITNLEINKEDIDNYNLPNNLNNNQKISTITQEYIDDLIKLILPNRPKDSHKHQFGHIIIIGGSLNMAGAVIMAGSAALRVGAGLVSLIADDSHTVWVNQKQPELMIYGFKDFENSDNLNQLLNKANVIIIGPGLSETKVAENIFLKTIESINKINNKNLKAVIIDADGLKLFAHFYNNKAVLNFKNSLKDKLVLTPHLGEAKVLLSACHDLNAINNLINDRIKTIETIAYDYNATVILKGADSLIYADDEDINPNNIIAHCNAGNPGMASAGMGDILSGMIAGLIGGLIGQGLNSFDASCLAVYLHARAGDIQAEKYGERGVLATDLLLELRKLLNFV